MNDWNHRVAVVMVDGGRAQLRDERRGQPRTSGEKKPKWWRESKVSLLATFQSRPQKADPLPEVPENLLDPLLQLCADTLNETRQMETFCQQRAETQTGRRKSRTTA